MLPKPRDINELLGNLRRRVTELVHGEYGQRFIDEMIYVKSFIESYSPEEIVTNLRPIYDELTTIDEDILNLVSDSIYDPESEEPPVWDYNGESPRYRMEKEVEGYIIDLEYYLKKYSPNNFKPESEGTSRKRVNFPTLKYVKFNRLSGKQNLNNFRIALIENKFINDISITDFKKIFSGKEQKIVCRIDWKGDANALRYFLKKLFELEYISAFGKRIDWTIVSNCFLYKGDRILGEFKGHSTKPSYATLIESILTNL